MDQAIYHAGTNKIFGVRGQWLFQFNATTGALEATLRFAPDAIGRSCMTQIGDNLYIGLSSTTDPIPFAFPVGSFAGRDIWQVTASTFTAVGRLGLDVNLIYSYGAFGISQIYGKGWINLQTDGVGLLGYNDDDGEWSLNTSFAAGYHTRSYSGPTDSVYDAINSAVWYANPTSPNIDARAADMTDLADTCHNTGNCGAVSGIAYASDFGRVYCVRNTSELLWVSTVGIFPAYNNFAFGVLNTGVANANPFKLKYVPYGGGHPFSHKILIPNFFANSVTVWDPATNLIVSTKTGFDSPFDIVNTPTKSFAVQSGVTGLKEIT